MAGSPATGPIDIVFTQADYGLRAHVTGTNGTLETTLAYWPLHRRGSASDPAARRAGGGRHGRRPPLPEQLLTFVLSMKGEGMEGEHIAYVERDAAQFPRVELAGFIAYEHGFNARIFDREEAAVVWMRYGER